MDGLEDVRLDQVMAYVTGCMKNGFERRVGVLWEMRVYEGRKKRPAGVLSPVDTDGVDASMLVEERGVHDQERESVTRRVCSDERLPVNEIRNRTPGEKVTRSLFCSSPQ